MSTRSNSKEKWYILLWINTLWIGSFHCILSTSALEQEMFAHFDLKEVEFALFSSIVFGFATLIAVFCPYIFDKLGLYGAMLFASVVVLFGQIIFITGIQSSHFDESHAESLIIMYVGRAHIGLGYGIQNIAVYITINVWFQYSDWLSFALNVANITCSCGMLTVRYCLLPLYNATNSLTVAYSLGILLSVVAVIGCIMMFKYENQFIQSNSTHHHSLRISLDRDFRKIKYFSLKTWLLIFYVIIGWSTIETFVSQFTLPLMVAFKIPENYANILLSAAPVSALITGLLWGYISSKYGHLSYFLMTSMVCMFVSLFIISSYGIFERDADHSDNLIAAWTGIIFFVTGLQHYFVSAFSSLFMTTPLEYSSIAKSISAILYLSGSMLEIYLFALLVKPQEATIEKYDSSILMMEIVVIIGFCIAFTVHMIDIYDNGPLHSRAISTSDLTQQLKVGENNDNAIEEGESIPLLSQ